MKKHFLFLIVFCLLQNLFSQVPQGYYDSTNGLYKGDLKTALHNIIKTGHTQNTYSSLWTHFQTTDVAPNGKVWDMYSNCNYTFVTNQCGNYNSECDCYNREHSTPASWFNDAYPMYADLFHLFPTDGWVNNRRANYPFGQVGTATYISGNGGKLGNSNYPGFSGIVFEPIDNYKGDFARAVFYMSTRYENVNTNWPNNTVYASQVFSGNLFPGLTEWSRNLYLQWHINDPVDQKEIMRNDAVYAIQGNRNPFIDDPNFALRIWAIDAQLDDIEINVNIFPIPFDNELQISSLTQIAKLEIFDMQGRKLFESSPNNFVFSLQLEFLNSGFYLVKITDDSNKIKSAKIIKN